MLLMGRPVLTVGNNAIMKKKKKNTSFWKAFKQNSKTQFIVKVFLSLFVLYHLSMIFISPHIMSLAHETLMPYFSPYASTLSLNTSWNFYAPNPAYYHYLTYEVIDSKSKVGDFRWPPKRKESKLIYLNHNRLIYHARFFIMAGPQNIRRYFIPYLCRLHPSATEITLKIILENRPHFKKAKTFKSTFFSANNQDNMKMWSAPIHTRCARKKKLRHIDSEESLNDAIEPTEDIGYEDTGYEDTGYKDE